MYTYIYVCIYIYAIYSPYGFCRASVSASTAVARGPPGATPAPVAALLTAAALPGAVPTSILAT